MATAWRQRPSVCPSRPGIRSRVGKEWVFTSDGDVALYRDAYRCCGENRTSAWPRRPLRRIGWSRSSRSSRSPTPTRFRSTRCPPAAIWATAGRRPTIPAASSSTEAHEIGSSRSTSGTPGVSSSLASATSTWCATSTRKATSSGSTSPTVAGAAHRERTRPRRRLYPAHVPQPLRLALRHGGRAGRRRGAANGHGRDAWRQELAGIHVRVRPVNRRDVLAVELRRRHQDGVLARPAARRVPDRDRDGLQMGRTDPAHRYAELPGELGRRQRDAGAGHADSRGGRRPADPALQGLIRAATAGDPSGIDAYAARNARACWNCTVKFYGPQKAIAASWEFAKEKFAAAIPGARFQDGESYKLPLTPEQRARVHKPEFGIPEPRDLLHRAPAPRSIPRRRADMPGFPPIIPRNGEAIFEANRVFAEAARKLDLAFFGFSLPTTYWMRSFIFLFGFPVTRDVAANKKNRERFKQLVDICAEHGWGEDPDRAGVSGRGDEHVFVQQPRPQTLPRARQGRGRSKRHLVRRPLRHLAEAPPR